MAWMASGAYTGWNGSMNDAYPSAPIGQCAIRKMGRFQVALMRVRYNAYRVTEFSTRGMDVPGIE